MLVLSRTLGESILIDGKHKVTLIRADDEIADVSFIEDSKPGKGRLISLPRAKRVEVVPAMFLVFVEYLADRTETRVRLGIDAAPDVHVKKI
ncbi:MAG TPA: hypothetical protein VGZ47_10390 [Gemmataceae bacterium]|nr:hypothetical protein [Gemmataceae bacterium]